MSEIRKYAVFSLQKIIEEKIFLSEIKEEESIAKHPDFAFFNMLLLTTLRHFRQIQDSIKNYANKELPKKQSFAKYAMILSACEILYMETPDYAAINSYINLIKKNNDRFVAGFANAVLRKIATDKKELLSQKKSNAFSQSFLKILQKDYNSEEIKKIQEAAFKEPPLDISVKSDPQTWAQKLGADLLPNGSLRKANTGKITSLEGYAEGKWWVQDFSASLAAKVLGNVKNKNILDLCAAPGGKTAQLLNAGAKVTSLDISASRLQKLEQNVQRLGLPAPEIICDDAVNYLQNFNQEPFDAILLDAPCSATGTLRRHPEIAYIKTNDDIEKMAALQQKILQQISPALKKGGILVYCTCSIAHKEGEEQINLFLKGNDNFTLQPLTEEDITLFPTDSLSEIITSEGYIRTLPFHLKNKGGVDSFFIAKLKKVK